MLSVHFRIGGGSRMRPRLRRINIIYIIKCRLLLRTVRFDGESDSLTDILSYPFENKRRSAVKKPRNVSFRSLCCAYATKEQGTIR